MDFMVGGLAGAGATIVTNPMDVVKTRLQLQGELKSKAEQTTRYRGIFQGLYVIARTDGLMALQKGLAPAMIFGFTMNSVRLGLYHIADVQGWTKTKGETALHKAMFWSSMCGILSGVASNPASVIKTRIQAAAHPSIAVGRQHVYKGMTDAFITLYKKEGMRGYFAGVGAACTRLAFGSSAQLTTFAKVKEWLVSRGICANSPFGLAFVASGLSGVASSIMICPFDVVTVRLYNQGSSKDNRLYTGVIDCIRKIHRTEGFFGLYKGFGPLYLRIAPHTTLTLVIWDVLNNVFAPTNKI